MPFNVTIYGHVASQSYSTHSPVKHPRSRIICDKTDGHVVRRVATNGHDIAPDRIDEIRLIATRNPDNIEVVLTNNSVRDKKGGVDHIRRADVQGAENASRVRMDRCFTNVALTGPPAAAEGLGKLISMTLFGGRT